MSAPRRKEPKPKSPVDRVEFPAPAILHHEASFEKPMREWASRAQLPPVLLLTGIVGVGKREMGRWLTKWILCENRGFQARELVACGDCRSCRQLAHEGDTVDFTEIRPNDDEGESGALKIERFRELKAQAGFSGKRVILIPNCDQMTLQAANSVLKLLEEPPRGWVIVLTASDPTLILPTVLSRCQAIRLKPLPREMIITTLETRGAARVRAVLCADLSEGSLQRAVELSDEENWKQRGLLLELLSEPGAAINPLVDWAAQDDRHLALLLNQLEHIAADLVTWAASQEVGTPHRWLNSDGQRSLDAHVARVTHALGNVTQARGYWIARAERLAQARQRARAPLNRKLLIQDLLLPWLWA